MNGRRFRGFLCLLAGLNAGLTALAGLTGNAHSEEPGWWSVRGVIDPAKEKQDLGVAAQGQAKHVVWQAYLEFQEKLAPLGGAGADIHAMVNSAWFQNTEKDLLVCQVGQLKSLAAPFHERLDDLGISSGSASYDKTAPRHWDEEEDEDDDRAANEIAEGDRAPAVIGQIKACFSFDFDLDADGLPDWWESRVFATLAHTGADDTDGDGLSNLDEFRNGTAAHLSDSDRDGVKDGEDANPNRFDKPKPVVRTDGIDAGGPGIFPAERLFEAENKARVARGLKPFKSMRREEVRPHVLKPPKQAPMPEPEPTPEDSDSDSESDTTKPKQEDEPQVTIDDV